MKIETEKDVTGEAAKYLREQSGLTQKVFWSSIGLTQSGGCRYENGQSVPKPVRILIFANYVAGFKIDATTPDGVCGLLRLAKIQASQSAQEAEKIGAKMAEAMSAVRQVNKLLANISG
jgi:transcriptional regulator with XRE-family HTH domain